MKLTRDSIAALALPAGKDDAIFFDDALPGFGVRLRGKSKRWMIQYRFGAKQRRESLGDVRKVTLEDARRIARNRFAQVELGTDPAADRAKARAIDAAAKLTLAVVAERYAAAKNLRPNTRRGLKRHFEHQWAPFRSTPIADIRRVDVAARLQEVVQESGAPTAENARASLSAMFAWAMREGLCENNPVIATNHPAKGRKPRDRVLSDAEIRIVWHACLDDDFGRIIKLLILTGCRREEIGGLKWSEVDLDTGTIKIPGERTKNHRALVLPLPPMAMALLPPMRGARAHVFGGAGFAAWAYNKLALDSRVKSVAPWVLHDLRRTMRTGLGVIGVLPHVAELVINHVKGGIEAIYDRHRYEGEIKAALAAWADHVIGLVKGA